VLKILLNYAITGGFHINSTFCEVFLEQELKYWAVDFKELARCCKTEFLKSMDDKKKIIHSEKEIVNHLKLQESKKALPIFKRLHEILEDPNYSLAAYVRLSLS